MKKIQLIAVNAKYMHTNLAVRVLRQSALPYEVEITELTINDQLWHSAEMILRKKSDIYCFSCYIWNFQRVSQLAEMIKKSQPDCRIYYGGPEVSYDAADLLEKQSFLDGVFCGEGEISFKAFVNAVQTDADISRISGLKLKENNTELQIVSQMDDSPFPYTDEEIIILKNRILYYESMRGCPFKCSYCLSSTLPQGVRTIPLSRVFEELDRFIEADVRQVKFVDRTFNILKPRAKEILDFLSKKDCRTNFHFEIAADLLDDEMLTIIANTPKGRFQFEAGIQSTFEPTLSAVYRKTDLKLLKQKVKTLLACRNCHVHVDLIAGLPFEDYSTFKHSYNDAIDLRPDMLQLGFLKLLKGTRIRQSSKDHHYEYQSFPPYEVIANNYISADELRKLKDIDHLTDIFYNSGNFFKTLTCVFDSDCFNSPFDFFESFATWWREEECDTCAHSQETLYGLIWRFISFTKRSLFRECLIFDALQSGCKNIPENLNPDCLIRGTEAFEIVKNEKWIEDFLSELKGELPKQRIKKLRICRFSKEFCQYFGFGGDVAVFSHNKVVFTHF